MTQLKKNQGDNLSVHIKEEKMTSEGLEADSFCDLEIKEESIDSYLDNKNFVDVGNLEESNLSESNSEAGFNQVDRQESTPETEANLETDENWQRSVSSSRNPPKRAKLCHSSHSSSTKAETPEESIARVWVMKLKRMPHNQRILAEKFISNILLEGELGTLQRHSVQINCV